MTRPQNVAAIENATGLAWDDWVTLLGSKGAAVASHAEIAAVANDEIESRTSVTNSHWWAQSVAVAFEQEIGRRVPGQSGAGDFQTSVSKTYAGDIDAALSAWEALVGKRAEFNGVPVEAPASTSASKNWRYWRVTLTDGTRVNATIAAKASGKSTVGINHTKLASATAGDRWREYWKSLLAEFAERSNAD